MGIGGTTWMWMWPVLVLLGLILLVVGAVRLSQGRPGPAEPASSATVTARQILDERLARGDIDEQEYQQRRNTLR